MGGRRSWRLRLWGAGRADNPIIVGSVDPHHGELAGVAVGENLLKDYRQTLIYRGGDNEAL